MAHPDRTAQRERRVISVGIGVVVAALALTYAIMPFARHWSAREASIDAAASRVAYLHALVGRTTELEADAASAERALSLTVRRVLRARSSTLAASAVQTLLQEAADASSLVVMRLDVSPDDSVALLTDAPMPATVANADANPGATADASADASGAAARARSASTLSIPATMSAYGDIAGVTHLLGLLATGPRVILVEQLTMVRNSALIGAADVVQVTMSLRVPVVPQ